jgi:hypothetical protein
MDKYKKAIKFYAEHNENFEFGNKNAAHASIVVSQLFQFAEEEVLIYSGSLNSDVTSDENLIEKLSLYLNTDRKLSIVLDNLPALENQSIILKKIIAKAEYSNQVQLVEDKDNAFANSLKVLFKDGKSHHFMVVDKKAYRIETDEEKYEAFGNFNDEKIATLLYNSFKSFLK